MSVDIGCPALATKTKHPTKNNLYIYIYMYICIYIYALHAMCDLGLSI